MIRNTLRAQLERLARNQRQFHLWTSLAVAWSLPALAGLALLLVHWLVHPLPVWGFPLFIALTLAGWVAVAIRQARVHVTGRDVARKIEAENPKLNASLLAAYEQEPGPDGRFTYLQQRVLREATDIVRKKGAFQKIQDRLFFAHLTHAFALLVFLFVFLGLLAYRPALDLRSQRAVASAALKEIHVSPGNAEVERGSSVAVVVQFPKPGPREAKLVFGPPGGQERTIDLQRSLDDPLFGGTIPDVQRDFVYRVEFSGSKAGDYTIKVYELPQLLQANATLNFPEYTKQGEKTIVDTTRITAVEGTKIHYEFQLNKPVKTVELVARDKSVIALAPVPGREAIYGLDLELLETKKYELRLVDHDGRTNKVPSEFAFTAQANRAPQFKLAFPRGDQRVSPLEEIAFLGETWDDFGLIDYGIAYAVGGAEPQFIASQTIASFLPPAPESGTNKAAAKKDVSYLLPLESLDARPDQLVSYFFWAEDTGPDGQPRRTFSDMFFAEVRPFEEIFRENTAGQSDEQQQQQQQGGGSPSERLAELQKQIITATWNIQRRESGSKISDKYKEDVNVVLNSQQEALQQAEEMQERIQDERLKHYADEAAKSMLKAMDQLAAAAKDQTTRALPQALAAEQSAYQALLKLASREYQVSRGRQQRGGGGGGGSRNQRQLDQLDLKQSEDRYETRSQAQGQQTPEQRENVQILSRLKDLARRQEHIRERLQELQAALQAANDEQREELLRELKRLREEQRQLVQDMDEVRERVSQQQNMQQASEALSQLDQSRQEATRAVEQMQQENVGQALSSTARTQQQLEQLKEDYRQETSSAFTQQMRDMREQAREMSRKQDELAQKIEQMKRPERKTLADSGEKAEVARQLERQGEALTNLLSNMRQVTEQAEASEPLLSRQLYDTLRNQAQKRTQEELNLSAELVRRSLFTQAEPYERRARAEMNNLREGVERAAESVLGNEAESLRLAQRELNDLSENLQEEVNRGQGRQQENGAESAGEPSDQQDQQARAGAAGREDPTSTNLLAQLQSGSTNRAGGGAGRQQLREGRQNAQGEASQQRQLAQNNASPQPGQQQAQGQQPGRQGQQGQQEQQQADRQGQGAGQQPGDPSGEQSQGRQQASSQQGQQGRQQGGGGQGENSEQQGDAQLASNDSQQPGRNQRGNRNGGGARGGGNFFENFGSGPAGEESGPLTGGNFRQWEDRLREVEELVSAPELREQIIRAREEARAIRAEFRRHSKEPQWDLVRNQVLSPLLEVKQRLAEELAKLESPESLVPIDRDPVPPKYADLVKNYYEKLGKD